MEYETCNTQPCDAATCDPDKNYYAGCSCVLRCADMPELEIYNNGTLNGFDFTSQCLEQVCDDGCRCGPGKALDVDGLCKEPVNCACYHEGVNYAPGPVDIGDPCQECMCDYGIMKCADVPCTRDCGFSEWTEWSECSMSCGYDGIQTRSRSPGFPAASNGGLECQGDTTETRSCSVQACEVCATEQGIFPISQLINETSCRECFCDDAGVVKCQEKSGAKADGHWTKWSAWSECSVTCSMTPGVRTRSRQCVDPAPRCGGAQCPGESTEYEECVSCVECPAPPQNTTGSPSTTPVATTPTIPQQTTTIPAQQPCELSPTPIDGKEVDLGEGEVCKFPPGSSLPVCSGACPSYDSSPIMLMDEVTTIQHDKDCKCCAGIGGTHVPRDVICGEPGATYTMSVMILEYSECQCNSCGSEAPAEPAP